MSIYDIDFALQTPDLMPPDKRVEPNRTLFKSFLMAAQWCRDLVLGNYRTGNTAPAFGAGPYAMFDQVLYQKKVYYSLKDSNADLPTNTSSWKLIQDNFIGFEQRLQFNGHKLIFEYALNKWFSTQFRQPVTNEPAPDYYLPKSDIYLITNTLEISCFRSGESEVESTVILVDDSSEAVYDTNLNFATYFSLTIMVPVAVWTALSAVVVDRDKIIRNFADKYITAGLFYDIQTY